MKVCDLTNGFELHADNIGNPFLMYPHATGLRPAGFCSEVVAAPHPEWAAIIDKWQADPGNDCLRARGDLRWQAACTASMRYRT